jgi:hypothetical protein
VNKRPGHVTVTTEVGFCSFCNRTRNLRREEHHLGSLVRTIITCESCHRTLSSSMGVAAPEQEVAKEPVAVEAETAEQEPAAVATKPKRAPAKRPAKKPAPAKPRSTAKTRQK